MSSNRAGDAKRPTAVPGRPSGRTSPPASTSSGKGWPAQATVTRTGSSAVSMKAWTIVQNRSPVSWSSRLRLSTSSTPDGRASLRAAVRTV